MVVEREDASVIVTWIDVARARSILLLQEETSRVHNEVFLITVKTPCVDVMVFLSENEFGEFILLLPDCSLCDTRILTSV